MFTYIHNVFLCLVRADFRNNKAVFGIKSSLLWQTTSFKANANSNFFQKSWLNSIECSTCGFSSQSGWARLNSQPFSLLYLCWWYCIVSQTCGLCKNISALIFFDREVRWSELRRCEASDAVVGVVQLIFRSDFFFVIR